MNRIMEALTKPKSQITAIDEAIAYLALLFSVLLIWAVAWYGYYLGEMVQTRRIEAEKGEGE